MNDSRYTRLLSGLKAPDSAVEKAVQGIYSNEAVLVRNKRPMGTRYLGVAATAAVLCIVLLVGVFLYPFGGNGGNTFVITADAAEINTYELVSLGELKCEFNSMGIAYNDDNEAICMSVCEWLDFPISCIGENIDEVTYNLKGKGFFRLSDSAYLLEKTEFDESMYTEACERLLLSKSGEDNGNNERLSSYTTDYMFQNQGEVMCLYVSEHSGEYCRKYNESKSETSDGNAFGEGFDYQQMYYDLFSSNDYYVDIRAKFRDGTTQTKTVELVIEKTDKDDSLQKKSTLTVSAKLVQ